MTLERQVRHKMLVCAVNLQVIVVTTLVEPHADNLNQRPEREYIDLQLVQHTTKILLAQSTPTKLNIKSLCMFSIKSLFVLDSSKHK